MIDSQRIAQRKKKKKEEEDRQVDKMIIIIIIVVLVKVNFLLEPSFLQNIVHPTLNSNLMSFGLTCPTHYDWGWNPY
jgi:uncharacterized protein YqhQ